MLPRFFWNRASCQVSRRGEQSVLSHFIFPIVIFTILISTSLQNKILFRIHTSLQHCPNHIYENYDTFTVNLEKLSYSYEAMM